MCIVSDLWPSIDIGKLHDTLIVHTYSQVARGSTSIRNEIVPINIYSIPLSNLKVDESSRYLTFTSLLMIPPNIQKHLRGPTRLLANLKCSQDFLSFMLCQLVGLIASLLHQNALDLIVSCELHHKIATSEGYMHSQFNMHAQLTMSSSFDNRLHP